MSDTEPSSNRELITTLVVVVLLSLVGAGAGFAVGSLLGEIERTTDAPEKAGEEGERPLDTVASHEVKSTDDMQAAGEQDGSELSSPQGVSIVRFPPVLTTIAEPQGKWIRLEGSVLVDIAGAKQPELLAEEAGEQILSYLRTVRLSQLESPSGILGIRDDLDETVRTLSEGQVRGVLVHGLVVE